MCWSVYYGVVVKRIRVCWSVDYGVVVECVRALQGSTNSGGRWKKGRRMHIAHVVPALLQTGTAANRDCNHVRTRLRKTVSPPPGG